MKGITMVLGNSHEASDRRKAFNLGGPRVVAAIAADDASDSKKHSSDSVSIGTAAAVAV